MRNVAVGVLIACLLDAGAAYAALGCYAEKCLPLVRRFDVDANGLRAHLGGRWDTSGKVIRTIRFNGASWTEGEPYHKPDREPRFPCPGAIRAHNYAEITDSSWQESDMTVCAGTSDSVYAGLGYYDGEGVNGRGGLLRLDRRSGRVEIRRLPLLEDVSVNAIAADGTIVWLGTAVHQECIGLPFAHGLVRYDWSTGETKTYEGSDDGPAGFVVHDLHLSGRALWVATDAGISRLDVPTGRWRHWLPEEQDGRIQAKELPAERILAILYRSLSEDCVRSDMFENQLLEGLAKFRPNLLAWLRRPSR